MEQKTFKVNLKHLFLTSLHELALNEEHNYHDISSTHLENVLN